MESRKIVKEENRVKRRKKGAGHSCGSAPVCDGQKVDRPHGFLLSPSFVLVAVVSIR